MKTIKPRIKGHSWGFNALLWTQFLGALNDNLLKMVVSFLAFSTLGSSSIPLVGALFIVPYLLFSGYAGQIADRFSKRTVLIVTKSIEIPSMLLALVSFYFQSITGAMLVLFLMSMQSTFFSPAKYGILPEMLEEKDLSNANGWLEMTTFLAIILGTALGGAFYAWWNTQLWLIGFFLAGIAAAGTLSSLGISQVQPSGANGSISFNPWKEIQTGFRVLFHNKSLWRSVVGITYFWFLGALFQMLLILLGKEVLFLGEDRIGLLWTCLALGIGAGSLAAGKLSGGRIELGFIPFGTIGMGVFTIGLAFISHSYSLVLTCLILIGFASGFFTVPLYAYFQKTIGEQEKGRLLATNNFINTIGIILASFLLWLLHDLLQRDVVQIIFLLGICTVGTTLYIARLLPYAGLRILLGVLTRCIFNIQIKGRENIPQEGPVLFVSNHMSYTDGLLIGTSVSRYIRFLVYKDFFQRKGVRWILNLIDAIPVSNQSRKDLIHLLRESRQSLDAGESVCIFAEGSISRTGNLLPFQRGLEKIVKGTHASVIPVHLDGLWGSLFSYAGGRFFWKWPQKFRYPVTISFGKPLPAPVTVHEVRQQIVELGSHAAMQRKSSTDQLPFQFLTTVKKKWFSLCMADSSGRQLTYGRTWVVSWLFSRWLQKRCKTESMIGLMLPASVGGAIANLAVTLSNKIPINLNFSTGKDSLLSAIDQCEIQTILTARPVVKKCAYEDLDGMVYIEDVIQDISLFKILFYTFVFFILPASMISRIFLPLSKKPDDLATLLFSSGSTGDPKGIMLSHFNILSNVEACAQVLGTHPNNRVCGILPFFHSFGLTGTLWMPLLKGYSVVYHPNPIEARKIGELCLRWKPGIMMATPTFCRGFLRSCKPGTFKSIHHLITGAEKLSDKLRQTFLDRFGVELLEGYGCTEMSPVVAVNTHDFMKGSFRQVGHKAGTIGHPLPGVAARIVDPDTGEILPPHSEGMLLVQGPNQMLGYWKRPDLTEQVFQDGWYKTGDIAKMDEDGFITLTDRMSRFSKIGGEMVPHIKVEKAVEDIVGNHSCAVTAVPDETKGERLVVFVEECKMPSAELWNKLKNCGLPSLWVPKQDDIHSIDAIPTLQSGKRDLRAIRSLGMQLSAQR